MKSQTIEINGTVARPYVKIASDGDVEVIHTAVYIVAFDIWKAGKAQEIYTAIVKAVAEKIVITLAYTQAA
jgi:hypothetical protein